MPNQKQPIEPLKKLLAGLAEEAEAREAASEASRLQPELEQRLLQMSLETSTEKRSVFQRIRDWFGGGSRARIYVPGVLIPTLAAILMIVFWSRDETENVDPYVLLASGQVLPQSQGHVMLSGSSTQVESTRQLKVGKRDAFTLVLLPPHPQHGVVEVRAFVKRGLDIAVWPIEFEKQPDSSFRLRLPVWELPGVQREQDLLFAIGRKDALPSAETLQAGRQGTQTKWHLLTLHLTVED